MKNRLRKILFSTPALTAMGLFVLYLACGFLALPAIVKWQIESQAQDLLRHRIRIGVLRFNPRLSGWMPRISSSPMVQAARCWASSACWRISSCAAPSIARGPLPKGEGSEEPTLST
ncbi:MAG: hypothetical protein IPK39_18510 [Sulfuritalea sp.]|nr:hypothetical protein [Sulfuritalea sp.]